MKYFVGIKTLKNVPIRYYTMKNDFGVCRMMAFKNSEHALRFKEYLSNYRALFKKWPSIDASVSDDVDESYCSLDYYNKVPKVDKLLRIIGWEEEHVKDISNSVDIIDITKFTFDHESNVMRITALDISLPKNIEVFRKKLEFDLKNTGGNEYM